MQATLFDLGSPDLTPIAVMKPTDPNVADEDADRLTGQNAAILERLKQGPASNVELAAISLKYTSRISDLRKHGHDVRCFKHGPGAALNWYQLWIGGVKVLGEPRMPLS